MTALAFVQQQARGVLIGTPGSGKSTFLEWLQLKIAATEAPEDYFILGGKQAIPLLLRVRQLDMRNLPRGAELIAGATASRDRAALMPPGWIERQMEAGRVLLMLDGLDETDLELRETYLLPWLRELCEQYPQCHFLLSSRPAGYAWETPRTLGFVEADLQDFDDARISAYADHWCTSIRLRRSEPEEEARGEGQKDGQSIVDSFKAHPYIRDLARNPLMLSAICLVNYFEGGELPSDRVMLYQLCVEGLLHHWDQRRGIRSEYSLEEKLRACREVAIAMQAEDRAEYEADKVQAIFAAVLQDAPRAAKLLEHIRYRAGLLIERRPGVFAFAHLTFQEYLAARAVHEGNRLHISAEQLVREHEDERWNEVIALYCGLAPASAARDIISKLIAQPDTRSLSGVLAEACLSACPEVRQDKELRSNSIERIARSPSKGLPCVLERFTAEEVLPAAMCSLGLLETDSDYSEASVWFLFSVPTGTNIDISSLYERLHNKNLDVRQIVEVGGILHAYGNNNMLLEMASTFPYDAVVPISGDSEQFCASLSAMIGLVCRTIKNMEASLRGVDLSKVDRNGVDTTFLRILRSMHKLSIENNDAKSVSSCIQALSIFLHPPLISWQLSEQGNRAECIQLVREIVQSPNGQQADSESVSVLLSWLKQMEGKFAISGKQTTERRRRNR